MYNQKLLFFSILSFINVAQAMAPQKITSADISFVNKTGYDLNLIITPYKPGDIVITKKIIVYQATKPGDAPHRTTLTNQDFSKIKNYTITYAKAETGLASYLPDIKLTKLTISADELARKGFQLGTTKLTVTITPGQMKGFLTGTTYSYGFAIPTVEATQSLGQGSAPRQISLTESIIGPSSNDKQRDLQEDERTIIYRQLGLSADAQAHDIFQMPPPPRIDLTQAKEMKDIDPQARNYFNQLGEKSRKLLEQWSETDKANQEKLRTLDEQMLREHGIQQFSSKVRNTIRSAMTQLSQQLGLKS